MSNKISLTDFLTDLRARNYTICTQDEITDMLGERGFETSFFEVGYMLTKLERLSYVKKAAKSNSGYRMVNCTQSISFSGCVWCGSVATNIDRICKSCSF